MSKFMLETPLHHCYLVSAQHVMSCVDTLKDKLEELAAEDELLLSTETATMDTLTIEVARQLRQRGQQKGAGETRCLIYGFDTITTEAQNALLKVIESPAEGTHFFFVTPMVGDLLETVRSRCWIINDLCDPVDASQIEMTAHDFLTADGLADRLRVIEKIDTKEEFRFLLKILANHEDVRTNDHLGQAVELAADYVRDAGASIKLLRQHLAVAASSKSLL